MKRISDAKDRYRILFTHSPYPMALLRASDSAICDINEAFERFFGRGRDELIGQTPLETRLWPLPSERARFLDELRQNGFVHEFQAALRTRSGELRYVLISLQPMPIDGEEYQALFLRDITQTHLELESLSKLESIQRAILDALPDPVWLKDAQGRLLAVNSAWCDFIGVNEADAIGKMAADLFPPEIASDFESRDRNVTASVSTIRYHEVLPDKTGDEHWFDTILKNILDEGNSVIGTVGIAREITSHRQAQIALAESESCFRAVVENAADGIMIVIPATGRLYLVNERLCQMLSYTQEEMLLLSIERLCACNGCFLTGSTAAPQEVSLLRKDGSALPAEVSAFPLSLRGQKYVVAFLRDVSERKAAQARTMGYEARLRSLAIEASLAEERERRDLAGHLHDDVCQLIALAGMKLSLARQMPVGDERSKLLTAVEELIARANRAARSLMLQLSHPALYDLGIAAAAEWLAEDIQRLYTVKVTFFDDGQPKPLELPLRVVLFQCLREILVNAAKYSGVGQLNLSLTSDQHCIRATVRDCGRGFDPQTLDSRATQGFGLFSVRTRLTNLGGTMRLHSAPGEGTSVELELPLEKPREALPNGASHPGR